MRVRPTNIINAERAAVAHLERKAGLRPGSLHPKILGGTAFGKTYAEMLRLTREGNDLTNAGKFAKAEENYRRAIEIGEEHLCNAFPWARLGVLLANQGRREEAKDAFAKAEASDPASIGYLKEFIANLDKPAVPPSPKKEEKKVTPPPKERVAPPPPKEEKRETPPPTREEAAPLSPKKEVEAPPPAKKEKVLKRPKKITPQSWYIPLAEPLYPSRVKDFLGAVNGKFAYWETELNLMRKKPQNGSTPREAQILRDEIWYVQAKLKEIIKAKLKTAEELKTISEKLGQLVSTLSPYLRE